MKDFHYVMEKGEVGAADYYEKKRETVLETIKPICETFGITDYDYVVQMTGQRETLVVEGQRIGCSSNSIGATVRELITYIFIKSGGIDKISYFRNAVANELKRYWLN